MATPPRALLSKNGILNPFRICTSSDMNIGNRPARLRSPTKSRPSSTIEKGKPERISNAGVIVMAMGAKAMGCVEWQGPVLVCPNNQRWKVTEKIIGCIQITARFRPDVRKVPVVKTLIIISQQRLRFAVLRTAAAFEDIHSFAKPVHARNNDRLIHC